MRISLILLLLAVAFAKGSALESLLKTKGGRKNIFNSAPIRRNDNDPNDENSVVAKNKEEVRLLFTADVVLPSSFQTILKKNPDMFGSFHQEEKGDDEKQTPTVEFQQPEHRRRRLQRTAQCTPTDEGDSLLCVIDDSPAPGLLSIFDCPSTAETLMDCDSSCLIFVADNVADIDGATSTCLGCSLCSIDDQAVYSFDCSNMSDGRCAQQDCRGGCVETNEGSVIECFPESTTTGESSSVIMDCALENAPRPGLVAVFRDCPADSLTSVLECNSCEIVEEDSLAEVTDASVRCTSCNLCVEERDVAFDCSNFHPEEPCAIQDCNSNCVNTPPPWPTPEPTVKTVEPTIMPPEPSTTITVTSAPMTTAAPVDEETTTTPMPTTTEDDGGPLIAPPFGPASSSAAVAFNDNDGRLMLLTLGAIAGVVFLQ